MLARCEHEQATSYAIYGGIGITVCAEWHDVRQFIAWIEENLGDRPGGWSLDRWPDKYGPYAPGNVRWASAKMQRENQRLREQVAA
jgi:hypothetical protein